MSRIEALRSLQELAYESGLGIKTFVLVFLGCETVEQAIDLVVKANP